MTNRDETLLISRDKGAHFDIAYSHHWSFGTCPMSSAFISETASGILAAAETHGRVFFVRLDPKTGKASSPVSPEKQAKHPVVIANDKGETLFVWAQGQGETNQATLPGSFTMPTPDPVRKGPRRRPQTWSLPTAFSEPDGNFTIIYSASCPLSAV